MSFKPVEFLSAFKARVEREKSDQQQQQQQRSRRGARKDPVGR